MVKNILQNTQRDCEGTSHLQILIGYLIYVTHMTPEEVAILFKWLSYVVKISSIQTI